MRDADILLQGASNFRDFGGYRTADGRQVRRRRLFRSETLSALTPADFIQLAQLGLRAVCDLRSKGERGHSPTLWPSHFTPETVLMDNEDDLRAGNTELLDILRRDPTEKGGLELMTQVYCSIPHTIHPQLRGLFSRLAREDGVPLLIHCTAGKDRTGVVAAVILQALGVSRADVVADYLLTSEYLNMPACETNIAGITAHMLGWPVSAAAVSAMATVRASYLDMSFSLIETHYGSLDGYLESAGIDFPLLERVKANLLQA